MLQASFLDCQFLDLLPVSEDGFSPAEVDVGRCDVVQAFVVTAVVVVLRKFDDVRVGHSNTFEQLRNLAIVIH